MDTILIVSLGINLWLASALTMLQIKTRQGDWIEGGIVLMATLFGPVSFGIILWFVLADATTPLWQRTRRWFGNTFIVNMWTK